MRVIIEKDSPVIPLLFLALVLLIFLCSGVGLAYLGGVFTGKDEVIANDKRIENQASTIKPTR
jgi:hypothetical protein